MTSSHPHTSGSHSQSSAPPPPTATRPWTTEEEVVLTKCWISVYERVMPVGPPHLHVGNDWNQFTHRFNNEMGQGNHRSKEDIESKWFDMAEKMKNFNNCFVYVLNYYNIRGWDTPDDMLERDAQILYSERYGTTCDYDESWRLLQNKAYFNM